MKEKPNPLAGILDAMKSHDNRLASAMPKTISAPAQPVITVTKTKTTPVQTVATLHQPRKAGEKVFCAARYTKGQIAKIDQIILLTHEKRGVRLNQSDILKKAIDRLPEAALEPGEVSEILAERGRKQLNT